MLGSFMNSDAAFEPKMNGQCPKAIGNNSEPIQCMNASKIGYNPERVQTMFGSILS